MQPFATVGTRDIARRLVAFLFDSQVNSRAGHSRTVQVDLAVGPLLAETPRSQKEF